MKDRKKKTIKIHLSPEVYDEWKRYCKYHGLTYEEAIGEIVTGWINHNVAKGQAMLAELRGDLDEIYKGK